MRFNYNRNEDMSRVIERKSTKTPKGILRTKRADSSEINEADEILPSENTIHIYRSSTKVSSEFSSGKRIPEMKKYRIS